MVQDVLKMLIVDDDKFERDGVRFLVEKYGFDLEIAETGSGEGAISYLDHYDVDILLSDIRMKGMDGLQLAEKVRESGRPIKVIFMSAYGEFEYAQRAISLEAVHYLLKPVQVGEFIKVLSNVIRQCEQERLQKEKQERMQEAYLKEVRYEKQKVLTNLILGQNVNELVPMPISSICSYPLIRMLMLTSCSRLFDREDFEMKLVEAVDRGSELIHLNEFQGLLLVEAAADETVEVFTELSQEIINRVKEDYGQNMMVAVSGPIDEANQLYQAYQELDPLLEISFFLEEGAVLQANRTILTGEGDMMASVNDAMEEIKQYIQLSRWSIVRLRFEQLFDTVQNCKQLSVVYIKYVCMEIVRSIFDVTSSNQPGLFKKELENINNAARLHDLRIVVQAILDEHIPSGESYRDGMPKAIEEVVRMIHTKYQTDLSLEWLAKQVYLSPSYLSYLFKKEKGISINKFITMYRMEKAKELLLTTNRKIIDISQDVGYSNFPYFSSLFKSHYGVSPSQYRGDV